MEQLQEAAAPIDLEAIFNCEEAVYGQLFQVPTAQHIAAFRLSAEAAAGLEQGLTICFARRKSFPSNASRSKPASNKAARSPACVCHRKSHLTRR